MPFRTRTTPVHPPRLRAISVLPGTLWNEIVVAFRMIRRSPRLSAVVILTLAVGIAASSNLLRFVDGLYFEPLPVAQAGRLVVLGQRSDALALPHGVSYPDFLDYRSRATSFSELAAIYLSPAHVHTGAAEPERRWVELVSADVLEPFGIRAALGRTLRAEDDTPGDAAPAVLLSHRYWKERFDGDRGVIDREITLNGGTFKVVGVATEDFRGLSSALDIDMILPAGAMSHFFGDGAEVLADRGRADWRVLGRLRPGVTVAAADREARAIGAAIARDHPETHRGSQTLVRPERRCRPDIIVSDYIPYIATTFVGLVALVLAIACANVANLLLARSAERRREFVMRAALGASRVQLFRSLLIESLLLSLAAGTAGFVLSLWADDHLLNLAAGVDLPLRLPSAPGVRDVAMTALIALMAGLGSGLLPALRASRADPMESVRSVGGHFTPTRHWLRNALVAGQVTFSMVILVCAGMFFQSLRHAHGLDLGFRPTRVVLASFDLGMQRYSFEDGRAFARTVAQRVRELPGVQAAGLSQATPFDYYLPLREVFPEEPVDPALAGGCTVAYSRVDPGFFEALGIPLLMGRAISHEDTDTAPRIAVINEAMARLFWPGRNPIGQRFRTSSGGAAIEVVGVTDTGRYVMLGEEPRPYAYFPLQQDYFSPLTFFVKTDTPVDRIQADITAIVHAIDPALPVFGTRTMNDQMNQSLYALRPMRAGASFSTVHGAIGLALVLMGLFAVVAYGVERRTREIGIRIALGANGRSLVRTVVKEGLLLTTAGLGLGVVVAAATCLALSQLLYGLRLTDAWVIAAAAAVILATASVACYWPARRAARVHPTIALRTD